MVCFSFPLSWCNYFALVDFLKVNFLFCKHFKQNEKSKTLIATKKSVLAKKSKSLFLFRSVA